MSRIKTKQKISKELLRSYSKTKIKYSTSDFCYPIPYIKILLRGNFESSINPKGFSDYEIN